MSGVSFVTETELDEIRQRRQEEWEKVRKPDDPLECPEEVKDNRTLYDRLEEQKQKKQEEWDEQHKLKNMIRGLDSDETVFLDLVSKQQEELLSRRFNEESQEIREYRDAVSQLQSSLLPTTVSTESRTPASAVSRRKPSQELGKKSQLELIAGAIKRKSSNSSSSVSESSQEKKSRGTPEITQESIVDSKGNLTEEEGKIRNQENISTDEGYKQSTESCRKIKSNDVQKAVQRKTVEAKGIPGLGAYTDSSDSESSTSESDTLATNELFKLS